MADTDRSKIETIKAGSNGLMGAIAEELADDTQAFGERSVELLKFHGVYQQDDRDVRRERTRQGLDREHIFMVRVSIPGGVLTSEQYLVMDDLADVVGNGTLRITTRQGIQYHFVRKRDLADLIAALNERLMTTLGACGDVVRNTMCCPAPSADRARSDVMRYVRRVAERFRPQTESYYEVWVDGERAVTAQRPDAEPVYGATYLPRKFKIGFAFPGDNCVDVYTHDVGIVPILDEDKGVVRAFTVLVGGGLGKSHNRPATFPRLADPLTEVAPGDLIELIEAIVAVQRDHGDRKDRSHARMKYLVHDWGIDRFRATVADRFGRSLPNPAPVEFDSADDHLGWHMQDERHWYLGVKIENGRVADRGDQRLRSGLRAAIDRFSPEVRLTPRGDVLLGNLHDDDRSTIDQIFEDHGILPAGQWVGIRRNAAACPALPTCGLALTESERVLPEILSELHIELETLGLGNIDTHVRMTGCPNGCSRPYTAEVGLVGHGKQSYDVHLGGEPVGRRLNTIFAENVPRNELVNVLVPVLRDYREHRHCDERFGDYCQRVGVPQLRETLGTEQWTRKPRRV